MPDDTVRFYVEALQPVRQAARIAAGADEVDAWVPVGHIDMDRPCPSHRDAFTAWVGEQAIEPPLGYYRVIERRGDPAWLQEFEIREHRERVIEHVEDATLAADLTTLSRAAMTPAPGSDAAVAGKGRSDG